MCIYAKAVMLCYVVFIIHLFVFCSSAFFYLDITEYINRPVSLFHVEGHYFLPWYILIYVVSFLIIFFFSLINNNLYNHSIGHPIIVRMRIAVINLILDRRTLSTWYEIQFTVSSSSRPSCNISFVILSVSSSLLDIDLPI